jgi:hypothetical protein
MATRHQWRNDVIDTAVKPVTSIASAVGSFLSGESSHNNKMANDKKTETSSSQRRLRQLPNETNLSDVSNAMEMEMEVWNSLNEYLADWLGGDGGDPDDLPRRGVFHDKAHRDLATKSKQLLRLGAVNSKDLQPIKGSLFSYHGNESSVPDLETALAFARKLPLLVGMPGPSFTWSAFSNSASEAEQVIMTDRLVTLVIERLDESLVVASYLLGWSLADMITVVNRKALSTHPKHHEWPQEAVQIMRETLAVNGENQIYDAGNRKLDQRIASLVAKGINITNDVSILQQMRQHSSQVCLKDEVLEIYRLHLKQEGFDPHPSSNKLRDTDDTYHQKGHSLSFNGELLNSYDVCGNCEAHAWYLVHHILRVNKKALENNSNTTTSSLLDHHLHHGSYLFSLPREHRINNIDFTKCPTFVITSASTSASAST